VKTNLTFYPASDELEAGIADRSGKDIAAIFDKEYGPVMACAPEHVLELDERRPGDYPAFVKVRDKENNRVIGRYGRTLKHAAQRVRAQLGGRFQEIDEEGGAT
jgi:hypothetical protein